MKSACLTILFSAMVVVGGCGSQDRYEVVNPEIKFVIEEANWGRVTALPTGAEDWDRPKCVVVRNADGTAPRTPQQLVLSRVSVAIKRELGGH